VKAHQFDPISMLLGVITVVIGFTAISSRLGNLINDRPDSLLPFAVLAFGVVAIAVAARRSLRD
jgi:hypothetical protein